MTEAHRPAYSAPLTAAESEEVGEIVGLIVATCARAVAAKTGLPRVFLLRRYTADAALEAVALEYLRATEEGQSKVEAAGTAGRWLLETTARALREAHVRTTARNTPPTA